VAQIYGKTPELFYKVAHLVCELGFDGLDINMGCPAKKVAASGCGAALIRTPALAREIIRAAQQGIKDWQGGRSLTDLGFGGDVVEQINAANRRRNAETELLQRRRIPVSIKTRLGYDRNVIEEWLSTLLGELPAVISLHGRTLEQGYKGEADWNAIARAVKIAEGSGVLIIGNGDLQDLRDACRRVRQTGVDGVFIGRGAQGEPWLFREKDAVKRALRGGGKPRLDAAPVPLAERFRVIIEHCEHFERLSGVARFVAMRKHLTWYCRNFRGAAEMRARMTRANNAADVRRCVAEFVSTAPDEASGAPPSTHVEELQPPESFLSTCIPSCG
jgi:tRNA-dihydrouridine synthase